MSPVVDISNSPRPKKSGGKPPPKPGPKPAVLVGVGIGLVIALIILLRFVFFKAADSNSVAPYDAPKGRTIQGANGGASGGARGRSGGGGTNVPKGLPSDGG